jgi:hypothetical protein
MAMVLRAPDYAAAVWRVEHPAILRHILDGDPVGARRRRVPTPQAPPG